MTSISTNFGAFNALVNLKRTEASQDASAARLSSGERISSTIDEPANFATSNQLRQEIRSLRDVRATNFETMSAGHLAEETMDEVNNMLARALELATWSASDVIGADGSLSKQARDTEYQEILATLDQMNDTIMFNDQQLFGATGRTMTTNLDPDPGTGADQVNIQTQPFSALAMGLAGTDILTNAGADVVIAQAKIAVSNLNRNRGEIGVVLNRIDRNITQLNNQIDSKVEQESGIRDTSVIEEAVITARDQILTQSNIAAMSQANLTTQAIFQLLN